MARGPPRSSGRIARTAGQSGRQVKWKATESRRYAGLSQRSSAAIVRISLTNTSGASRSRSVSSAANAATACSRATKNSLWSSSPWLGVWSSRKCGSRSSQGPGTPSCSVHASGDRSRSGWRGTVASRAPNSSGWAVLTAAIAADAPLAPDLVDDRAAPLREQADAVARRRQLVEVVAQGTRSADPRRRPGGRGTWARRSASAGSRRPSAPSETTDPANASPSAARLSVTSSPSARTSSIATTAVDRFPSRSPDPCVAVTQAPATEMCGSDARLWSARPAASSAGPSSPYRMPPSIVTVPPRRIDLDDPRQPGERQVVAGRVGEVVERVARPEDAHRGRRPDRRLHGLDRLGLEEPPGAIRLVARPVPPRACRHGAPLRLSGRIAGPPVDGPAPTLAHA